MWGPGSKDGRMKDKRWVFPAFNGLICGSLGGVVGYYLNDIFVGIFIGGLIGVLIGVAFEWLLGKLGEEHWL